MPNGTSVSTLSAVVRGATEADNIFYDVDVFAGKADECAATLRCGDIVFVDAVQQKSRWTDADGKPRCRIANKAREVIKMDGGSCAEMTWGLHGSEEQTAEA